MSVHGDWWLYPDNSCQEMAGSEHAEIALKAMLKLPAETRLDRRKLFLGLAAFTLPQLDEAIAKGVQQDVFDFLSLPDADPRVYAIKYWGWIRIAKQALNCWDWTASAEIFRRSSYWSQQPAVIPPDMFDIAELSTNKRFSLTVEKIMGGDNLGEAVTEPEVEKIYVGPRRGAHTDTSGKSDWQYRRIGDNRRRT